MCSLLTQNGWRYTHPDFERHFLNLTGVGRELAHLVFEASQLVAAPAAGPIVPSPAPPQTAPESDGQRVQDQVKQLLVAGGAALAGLTF